MKRCDGCGHALTRVKAVRSGCACPNCGGPFVFEIGASVDALEIKSRETMAESRKTIDSKPSDNGSRRKILRRISTSCMCGEIITMPMTAIDMTVACLACGRKVRLDSDMLQAEPTHDRREPQAIRGMEALGIIPYPGPPDERIGELMVNAGLIDAQLLREALSVQAGQGGKLAEVLIQLRHIDRATFFDFLGRQQGVRSIVLKNYRVEDVTVGLVPYEFALDREVCPIEKLGSLLTVGMACPLDSKTIMDIEELTGLTVMPYLCLTDEITGAITRFHPQRELTVFDREELSLRETG